MADRMLTRHTFRRRMVVRLLLLLMIPFDFLLVLPIRTVVAVMVSVMGQRGRHVVLTVMRMIRRIDGDIHRLTWVLLLRVHGLVVMSRDRDVVVPLREVLRHTVRRRKVVRMRMGRWRRVHGRRGRPGHRRGRGVGIPSRSTSTIKGWTNGRTSLT